MDDVDYLQLMTSKAVFEKAADLFVCKYKSSALASIREFTEYWKSEWVDQFNGWYEGASVLMPSTNKPPTITSKKNLHCANE
jgi:hypothetical protein